MTNQRRLQHTRNQLKLQSFPLLERAMYIAIDESKGVTCRTAKLPTYVMKKAILLYTFGLVLLGQTAFASTNPQPAINKLSVLTNAVIRGQVIPPASPGAPVVQLDSPAHDTNSWFQALPDNGSATVPDTHGAVGPNHVITTLNTQVRIQNRTGTTNHLTTATLKDF
jgi:hypothetical protein